MGVLVKHKHRNKQYENGARWGRGNSEIWRTQNRAEVVWFFMHHSGHILGAERSRGDVDVDVYSYEAAVCVRVFISLYWFSDACGF